jgi:hypothetical protein
MMDFLLALNGLTEMGWLLQNFGPLLTAVVFFIWRDFRREDKLSKRIKELEDEQRKVILPLVKNCTEVITKSTQVMEQNTKVMERLESVIDRTLNK